MCVYVEGDGQRERERCYYWPTNFCRVLEIGHDFAETMASLRLTLLSASLLTSVSCTQSRRILWTLENQGLKPHFHRETPVCDLRVFYRLFIGCVCWTCRHVISCVCVSWSWFGAPKKWKCQCSLTKTTGFLLVCLDTSNGYSRTSSGSTFQPWGPARRCRKSRMA